MKLKVIALTIALSLSLWVNAKADFFWNHPSEGEKKIVMDCRQMVKIKKQTQMIAKTIYGATMECRFKTPAEDPMCMVPHATLTMLKNIWQQVDYDYKTNCSES